MIRENVDFEIGDIKYRVYKPSLEDQKEANKIRNSTFMEALSSGAPVRRQLRKILVQRGVWGENHEKELDELDKKINDAEIKLRGEMPLEEAKEVALHIKKLRLDKQEMLTEVSELDSYTAEAQADNMSFNYLISACVAYIKDDKEVKCYENLNDYLNRSDEPVSWLAANKLMFLMHSIGDDAIKALPENEFLLKFGFMNDNLQLIDKKGNIVDENGNILIEKETEQDNGG